MSRQCNTRAFGTLEMIKYRVLVFQPFLRAERYLGVAHWHRLLSTYTLAKRLHFQPRSCVCCVGMVKEAEHKGCMLMKWRLSHEKSDRASVMD